MIVVNEVAKVFLQCRVSKSKTSQAVYRQAVPLKYKSLHLYLIFNPSKFKEYMKKLVKGFLFIFLLTGCSKPGDKNDSTLSRKIYYDTYSAGSGPGGIWTDFVSKRVCYDVAKDQVVWEMLNDHIMPSSLIYGIDDIEYSKAFIKEDYLIKIFPAKDDPASLYYNASGIYFEKIDKLTGQAVISNKIINSTEFNTSPGYIMSNVIADGNNFIFGCNNGFIYCYDIFGNTVWKKANFPIKDSQLGNGKATIFYDDGKLYFFSVNPSNGGNELYCLNAQTGETVWHTPGSSYISSKAVFFDKVNIYISWSCGVYFQNKITGTHVNSSPYSNCSSFSGRSIGSIDGVTAIVFSKANEIGIIHTPIPDPMISRSFPNNPFSWNYFFEEGLIYGGDTYSSQVHPNSFVFACYDFKRERFNWEISYPLPINANTLNHGLIFNYKSFNDEIYLLTNFHIDDGQAVLNEKIKPNLNPNGIHDSGEYPGIIVLDKQTGRIKRQIKKMPANNNPIFAYNFCID